MTDSARELLQKGCNEQYLRHRDWCADANNCDCGFTEWLTSLTAILAAEPDATPAGDGWISVDRQLPVAGRRVECVYINSHGHQRRTLAHYAPKHTISASHWEDAETDDTEDGSSWEPQGWWEDYAEAEYINQLPDTVTHWRELGPLPAPPTDNAKGKS